MKILVEPSVTPGPFGLAQHHTLVIAFSHCHRRPVIFDDRRAYRCDFCNNEWGPHIEPGVGMVAQPQFKLDFSKANSAFPNWVGCWLRLAPVKEFKVNISWAPE